MEIKSKIEFKSVVDEKEIVLQCERECPLGMIHDFLHEMLAFVVKKISEENQKVDLKSDEEKSEPEEKVKTDDSKC